MDLFDQVLLNARRERRRGQQSFAMRMLPEGTRVLTCQPPEDHASPLTETVNQHGDTPVADTGPSTTESETCHDPNTEPEQP